jgi:hypothetical protein
MTLFQGWFSAKYPGLCSGCKMPIAAGDLITKSNQQYYGECCEEELAEEKEEEVPSDEPFQPLRAGETICPSCHLVRPCFC